MRKIKLTHGFIALVDNDDYEFLNCFNWSICINPKTKMMTYPRTYIGARTYYMHYFLIKQKQGLVTDHKDQNPLNNQKNNLRCITKSHNGINAKISIRNKTGFVGVSLEKGRYHARIRVNGQSKSLGFFDRMEDAVAARINAETKLCPGIKTAHTIKNKKIDYSRTPVPEVRRYRNATRKYKGVHPHGNKWRAVIRTKGKNIHLGLFYTEKAAANAFNKKFNSIYV